MDVEFCQRPSRIYWDNLMAFSFQFVNVVYYINWFADIEESFHPWDKAHSVQHRTFLMSLVPSTTGCCFCFGSIPSFFLELFLHWSPVAYWAPTNLGSSAFSVPIFLPFHTVHGVLRARILKWFAIPFSSGPHPVRTNCQHLLDHRNSKRIPEKHLFLLYWLCQTLWLCGSQ